MKISKPYWKRKYENGHYYYILCVDIRGSRKEHRLRLELAGVDWCDGCKSGGWRIAVIGYTEPLKTGWRSVDDKHYSTAWEARKQAEFLLKRVVRDVGKDCP